MTETDQRIAIAEACGHYVIQNGDAFSFRDTKETTIYPWHCTRKEAWTDAPDYLHDLNAMHVAESSFTPKQSVEYNEALCRIVVWLGSLFTKPTPDRFVWHATAAQRAEAFLRTIGKWADDPLPSPATANDK